MKNKLPKVLPHIIHGDIVPPKFGYPTHTHGLEKIGWPEFFINSTAFGAKMNAQVINEMFIYLWEHEDDLKKLISEKFIEVDLWPGNDYNIIFYVRIVDHEFLAVKKTYTVDELSTTGHAQIYVKGDNHVLKDSFYENAGEFECNKICSQCKDKKGETIH